MLKKKFFPKFNFKISNAMAKKTKNELSLPTIVKNRRARYEYFIEEEIESGLLLQGWEVKSIRAGGANISDSYVLIKNGEAYLIGATLPPLAAAYSHIPHDSTRTRKLLLKKRELASLFGKVRHAGYTILALSLYWKGAWVKVKIGVARGKREYDKRRDIKEREWKLNKERIMKNTSQ